MMQQPPPEPPQNNNNNANNNPPRPRISFTKLIIIAILAGLGLFLQVTVWTLEVLLNERQAEIARRDDASKDDDDLLGVMDDDDKPKKLTTKSIDLPNYFDLHVNRVQHHAKTGASRRTQAQAWWKQASELWLQSWDPNVEPSSSSNSLNNSPFSSSTNTNLTVAWHALEQAANAGHPDAQFHVANAYSSGIFLGHEVQDTWSLPDHAQHQTAWLLWHMSAMAGHVESMLALAVRMEESGQSCDHQLPYYQQAALNILDTLEADPQSRAKVLPVTDKHVLYQIHLHGGTPSKLEFHNKADESSEALQFYHLRAYSASDKETAAGAAYTLANYYHHGVRGVTQNLTLAAEYYERAANLNHWEAAGELGNFFLWGMGVPQDAYRAHKFFRMGMPLGIAGCQRRLQARLKKNNLPNSANANAANDPLSELPLCDTDSLNGMGLLKLFGLSHVNKVDVSGAEDLFLMARDQGSADAAYNHAMLKLGWTVHWKPMSGSNKNNKESSSSSSEDSQTTLLKDKLFSSHGNQPKDHPTLSEYQAALTDLTLAAGKGHIQARLRLGLLFAEGAQVPQDPTSSSSNNNNNNNNKASTTPAVQTAVSKDCHKALKQFKWIAENACPQRTRRLRRAYKQYMAGDTQGSLLNYLAAAETGSTVALLNAAFLLEQGECLQGGGDETTSAWLSRVDCAKASARLWKAAANKGHGEASLRVGDLYYFRKLREPTPHTVTHVGPFGYLHHVLYPEESLPQLWTFVQQQAVAVYQQYFVEEKDRDEESKTGDSEQVCQVDEKDQQCPAVYNENGGDPDLVSDLEMAAHYYRMATETVDSARAHFNLAFLYEWGLGLKQDFPLAKRHYDLAVSSSSSSASSGSSSSVHEAELPVAIALFAMNVHEKCLKWWTAAEQAFDDFVHSDAVVSVVGEAQADVLTRHLFRGDSVVVLGLLVALLYLLLHVRGRGGAHQR